MEKYNSYDVDLKAGDKIVFNNGDVKAIKKIKDGHRVTFEDGSECDLWVYEDKIAGIIRAKTDSKNVEDTISELQNIVNNARAISLATGYKELKELFAKYNKDLEFYHLTAVDNATRIFADGYFYSRESGEDRIAYDNKNKNEISKSVMSSNNSSRVDRYARFYLNIKNRTAYAMKKNFEHNNTFGMIIAVGFDAIKEANTPVILSPVNAHDLTDRDFNWSIYNLQYEKNFKNLEKTKFNLEKTYSICDFEEKSPFLAAEVLFFDKISIDLIKHIYFDSPARMGYFLDKLPYEKRNTLKNKCVVKKELFW